MVQETLVVCYTGEDPPSWIREQAGTIGITLEPVFKGEATARTEAEAATRLVALRPHGYVMNWPWDPYFSATLAEADDRLGLICYLASSRALEDYEPYADVTYLRRRGIVISSTPGCTTISVAEGTLALLLALNVGLVPGRPVSEAGPQFPHQRRKPLFGSTLGIVGMGSIGERVARLAFAMGMRIRYYSRSHREVEDELAATFCDLPTLFATCDYISIHTTAAPTRGLIGREVLSQARGITLINTASAGIVDRDALQEALGRGWVRIAASNGKSDSMRIVAGGSKDMVYPFNTWYTTLTWEREWEMCLEILLTFKEGRPVPHLLREGGRKSGG